MHIFYGPYRATFLKYGSDEHNKTKQGKWTYLHVLLNTLYIIHILLALTYVTECDSNKYLTQKSPNCLSIIFVSYTPQHWYHHQSVILLRGDTGQLGETVRRRHEQQGSDGNEKNIMVFMINATLFVKYFLHSPKKALWFKVKMSCVNQIISNFISFYYLFLSSIIFLTRGYCTRIELVKFEMSLTIVYGWIHHMGQATEMRLSCYLALLPSNTKTR